jgi:hypothetical protein
MSKRILKILMPLDADLGVRATTSNILKFINRVPCDAETVNRPSNAAKFV